jgi:hypothetical protein
VKETALARASERGRLDERMEPTCTEPPSLSCCNGQAVAIQGARRTDYWFLLQDVG